MASELLTPPNFVRFAKQAVSAHPSGEKFKLAAVIIQKNCRIAVGINYRYKTHPSCREFDPHKTVHAEINAIMRTVNKDKLKGSTIVVYRQDNHGNSAMARPCDMCEKMLRKYGVKKMIYTNNNGTWTEEIIVD